MNVESRLLSVLKSPAGKFRLILLDTEDGHENAYPQGDFTSIEEARVVKSERTSASPKSKYGIYDENGNWVG